MRHSLAPSPREAASWRPLAVYTLWVVVLSGWIWRGGRRPLRFGWLALFVDIALLGVLSLVAGVSQDSTWTAFVLGNGFFLVPVMAATQLRPYICAAVVGPTVLAYGATNLAARVGNDEP